MEGRVNYLLVGIFVTVFLAGIFSFAFWLIKYSNYEQMNHYVVHFNESVAGLSKDASVKYMGVDAGVVEDIKVHPTNTLLVSVYLKINHDIKIKEDMQATLKFYGMTGLAYIEISGTNPNAPLLKSETDEIPIIQSSPSIFTKLDETLADLVDKLSTTSQKIDQLLSKKNIQNVESTLENISAVTGELKTNKTDISNLIKKASLVIEKIEGITNNLDTDLGKDIQTSVKEFKAASRQIKILIHTINNSLKRGDYNLKEITHPTLQKLSTMIDEISNLSIKIEEVAEQIEESPSDLLFKREVIKLGPGEH
jgi:phospholipid/cholesterol/gamma-HCH transport system substrate-binding protein